MTPSALRASCRRWSVAGLSLLVFLLQPSSRAQVRDAPLAPWDAGTRYTGYHGPSSLTIKNDCNRPHSFSVTKTNADFLDLTFTQPVQVPAKQSVTEPVVFRAGNAIGDHTGHVTIKCLDCDEAPPCTQNVRDVDTHIRVVPDLNNLPSNVSRVAARICSRLGVVRTWTDEAKARNAAVLAAQKAIDDNHAKYEEAVKRSNELGRQEDEAFEKLQANTDPAQAAALKAAAEALRDQRIKAELDIETAWLVDGTLRDDLGSAEDDFTELFGLDLYFSERDCPDPITDGPIVARAISTTESVWDCDQYGQIADQKDAAAKAAQAAADAAAADADRAARAAAASPAGKDPRDVTAAKEVAEAARANQKTLQDEADIAKAAAAGARKLANACKRPPRTTPKMPPVGPCPVQGDCAAAEAAWREAEHEASILQAIADREKQNQTFDNEEADYLERQAARDEQFAKETAARAAQMRDLAGGAAGLEMRDREIAARSPAGSKDRTQWSKAAEEDHAAIAKWNKDADEAEAEALRYRTKAAEARVKARQLRGGSTDAQAKADAARAAAAAAKRLYEQCQDALRRAQQECARQAQAAASSTAGRGAASGRGSGVSTSTPAATPRTVAGGNPSAPGVRDGLGHIPGVGGRTVDRMESRLSKFCHWVTFTLPRGRVLEEVYARPIGGGSQTSALEAKKGQRTASGDTLQYHCMSDDASAIVTYTYTYGNEPHIGRIIIGCTK